MPINLHNCRCGNKIGEFFATNDHKGFVNFVFSSKNFVFCGASRGILKTLKFGTLHAPTRSVCSVTAFGRSVCSVVDSVPPLLPRWHGFYHDGTGTACGGHKWHGYRLRRTQMIAGMEIVRPRGGANGRDGARPSLKAKT